MLHERLMKVLLSLQKDKISISSDDTRSSHLCKRMRSRSQVMICNALVFAIV